jgi:hypothetical protein
LIVAELQFIEKKMKKSMGGWMSGTMSIGGRLVKIDACLSNICCVPNVYEATS